MEKEVMDKWDIAKSARLYNIDGWGDSYFSINAAGNVAVKVCPEAKELDLNELMRALAQRGVQAPVLLRFNGILRDRVKRLATAFASAIKDFDYKNNYTPAFPIKVNQQRHVVEVLLDAGAAYGLAIEVGSKPELMAALALHSAPGSLLLCNGYKDKEYIELALTANKIGRKSIIIIEQLYELEEVVRLAKQLNVEPHLGVRMKPLTKGSGKWEASGGDKAKFGLSSEEIVSVTEKLDQLGFSHWLELLHFHVGSQITSINAIKQVLRETTRMFIELKKLCPSLSIVDVGGGLAVDYDGSRTNFESSMNYSMEEYARDIVYALKAACEESGVDHPRIMSESGRALTAQHAVLITEVVDSAQAKDVVGELPEPCSEHKLVIDIREMYANVSVKNCQETLNDAISLKVEALEQFIQGKLSLKERAYVERALWHLVAKLRKVSKDLKYCPEDLERLDDSLKDLYFCNFSVFQSLPDAWAIGQLFPIMPIHRLAEEPCRKAVLADMSCDSDGKMDRFIDLKDVKTSLPLHAVKPGELYYLGFFLVGAYQEIMGDLHNLFGDTNAVHVEVDAEGRAQFPYVIPGDTAREVLSYVQYDPQELSERWRLQLERCVQEQKLKPEESARLQRRYKEALDSYTYLYVENV